MTKDNGPWDNDNPWNAPQKQTAKIIKIPRLPKKNDFEFNISWAIAIIALLWLATGFYQVQPNEQGVVLRFGKYVDSTTPGLNYHLPYPIETVKKVNFTQERSINLGVNEVNETSKKYRSSPDDFSPSQLADFTESHMLTGDENIVDVNLTVVWKIKNAKDYLFSMQDPDNTVRVASQSVLREIVGQSEMQPIITGDRGKVEDETKEELQKVMDEFHSGIEIVRVKLQKADPPKQVVDAFNEVQRAKADMERFKNEAEAYRNEILPKARGEAAQLLQNAQAYKEAVVNKAQGEADRFNSVYNAYNEGRNVTARRMYLETMEKILADSDKIIIDQKSNNNGVVPYLPLDKLK